MATIQRPLKQYDTRKYVDEVAADPDHLVPVLAAEMDADFDVIYDAWNGGVDAVNIRPGVITSEKIADGSITDPKIVSVSWSKVTGAPPSLPPGGTAGGDLQGTYPNPQIRDKSIWGDLKIQDYSIVGIRQLFPGTVDTPQLAMDAATQFANGTSTLAGTRPMTVNQTTEILITSCSVSPASRGGLIFVVAVMSGLFVSSQDQGLVGRIRVGGTAGAPDGAEWGVGQTRGFTNGLMVPVHLTILGLVRGASGGTGPFKLTACTTGAAMTAQIWDAQIVAFEFA